MHTETLFPIELMLPQTQDEIDFLLAHYQTPTRSALSQHYPILKPKLVWLRQSQRKLQNSFHFNLARQQSSGYFDAVTARHQSLLMKKLGTVDMRLQKNKVVNLQRAIEYLDKLVIAPGQIFSFWETVGKPTAQAGYVTGMLLSSGKVIEGTGGGLCQLSNLLYWLFLHSPVEILERHHHSFDVFPDDRRVLPFGSGATIFYNYLDLKVKNTSNQPLQLRLWLTDQHVKGQILSPQPFVNKYHVIEKEHCFIKSNGQFFRYNQIYRQILHQGKLISEEKVVTNFAPVLYTINQTYLSNNDYTLLSF